MPTIISPKRDFTIVSPEVDRGSAVTVTNADDVRITRGGNTRITRGGNRRVSRNTSSVNPIVIIAPKRDFVIVSED